jgi:Domain of unknown function (DUF929)
VTRDKQTAPHQSAAQRLAAQRSAAARERLAAAQRRRRLLTVGSAVATVVAVVAVLVIVKVVTGAGSPKSGQKATAGVSTVITEVASVPASAFDAVGVGTASAVPKTINAALLTSGGEPRVLYVGAEYCPYCAAERWALAAALYRFGIFANLGQTASSPSDVYPSTATLTFHGATYTSSYIAFTGKEIQSNQVANGSYTALDTLSAADQKLYSTYDSSAYFPSGGGIPFIDIGGKYLLSGASYSPTVLQGKTHAQIAAALSDPTSAIAKGVDGTANLITAAICQLTKNQPRAVCTSSGVTTATAKLSSGS